MAEEQLQLFEPPTLRASEPFGPAVDTAKRLTGGKYNAEELANTSARADKGYLMYKTFDKGQKEPLTPEMQQSYRTLIKHLGPQFESIVNPPEQGGMGVDVEFTQDNPYDTYEDMREDLANNNRMRIWSTAAGGTSHDIMTDEENDKFRAVHDMYGHMATGRNFDRHGEEAAYQSHRQMFPPEAHPALVSETRGQNSYLNWGNIGKGDWGAGAGFPPNAPANIPQWMAEEDPRPPAPLEGGEIYTPRKDPRRYTQLELF